MSYAASRGNIIILIIALVFLIRIFGGIFSPAYFISRNSNSTYSAAEIEKEKSSDQIPQEKRKRVKMKELYSAAEKGDTKAQIASFMLLAGLIVLVLASVFFIVEGFGVSGLWGVCLLLFNGITIVLFSIFHWNRAKAPLLVYLVGVFLLLVGNVLAK